MFGYSGFPLLIILLLILIIFGSGKLPEIGTSLGRGIRNFKKALEGKEEEDTDVDEKKKDESNGSS